jgi:hypothetical protein
MDRRSYALSWARVDAQQNSPVESLHPPSFGGPNSGATEVLGLSNVPFVFARFGVSPEKVRRFLRVIFFEIFSVKVIGLQEVRNGEESKAQEAEIGGEEIRPFSEFILR